MAIQINVQGFVDSMVQRMQDDANPLNKEAIKAVSVQFSTLVESAVDRHTAKIAELKSVADGAKINSAAIAYHEARLAFYLS